ncbi:MAG: HNH endonuclease [Lewinellaceae bacterium]|nr:HNH endonuclease [Lewinellaceae bacterium]
MDHYIVLERLIRLAKSECVFTACEKMSRKIPDDLRRNVPGRAAFCCEYCRLPEKAAFFSFQVDHIISVRHDGKTDLDNLAFACPICNRKKGTDLGTLVGDPPQLIRFSISFG